jgi:hypothetical protein
VRTGKPDLFLAKSICAIVLGVIFTMPALLLAEATTTDTVASSSATSTHAIVPSNTEPEVHTNDGLEAKVRAYFPATPIMIEIARCESRFRQYDASGAPLDGGAGSMIGIFQINAPVHASFAKSIGMDIYTAAGNLAYAQHLYAKEGTNPWLSSITCWKPADSGPTLGSGFTSTLTMGMENTEVLLLQRTLNAAGFLVAADGPGSPGQETIKFGAFTRAAVRKFQCAQNIVCSGDEYSTGYGLVGKQTRTALIAIAGTAPASAVQSTPASPAITNDPNVAEVARLQALIATLTAQLFALKQKTGLN